MARSGGKNCGRHVNPKLNSWWITAVTGLSVALQKVLEGSRPQVNLKNNRTEVCVLIHGL